MQATCEAPALAALKPTSPQTERSVKVTGYFRKWATSSWLSCTQASSFFFQVAHTVTKVSNLGMRCPFKL